MRKKVEKYLKNNEYRELRNYVVENSENATLIYLANILYSVYNGATYLKKGEGNSLAECIIYNDFEGLKRFTTELPRMLIDPIVYYNNININYNIQGLYLNNFYNIINIIDETFTVADKNTKKQMCMYLKSIGRSVYVNAAKLMYEFSLLEENSSYIKNFLAELSNPTYTVNEDECKSVVYRLLKNKRYDSCECYINVLKNLDINTDYFEYRLRMEKNNLIPVTEEDIKIEKICDEIARKVISSHRMNLVKFDSAEDIKKILWRLKSKCLYTAEKIKYNDKNELIIFPRYKTKEKVDYNFLSDYVPKQIDNKNYDNAIRALEHSISISDTFNIELVRQLMNIYKIMGSEELYKEYSEAVNDYYKCYGNDSGFYSSEEPNTLEDKAFALFQNNCDINEYINSNNLSNENKNLLYIYLAKFSYENGNIKNGDNYLKPVVHDKEKSKNVKRLLKELENRKRFIQYK